MRGGNNIRVLSAFFLVVAASIVFSGVAQADPVQNRQPITENGLPSDPKDWVCRDSTPATQEEIDAWCQSHSDRGQPLPPELRNPPPVADFDQYLDYSNRLKDFLTGKSYEGLGWVSDAHWRLRGPSVGDFAHNYGPHFPLKVYYSPEIVDWLCSGRKGDIPDGAMMVKAMAFFSGVQTNVAPDGCMDVGPRQGSPISPILWAPMLKSSQSSHDGWLWMLQQADLSFLNIFPQFPPPLFDTSAFTVAPPSPVTDNPLWYPTGSLLEGATTKIPDVVMLNPLAGFPYCMSCHSTAKSESTFASMDNILGKELRYKAFPAVAATPTPTPGVPNFDPFPHPLTQPSQAFLSFFDQLAPVSFNDAWATRIPAESYEQQGDHLTQWTSPISDRGALQCLPQCNSAKPAPA